MTSKLKMGFQRNYSRFSFRKKDKNHESTIPEQNKGLLRDTMEDSGFNMILNKGEDDELMICGYRKSGSRTFFTYSAIVLTLGMLRLVFHWVPHWLLKATHVPCVVQDASKILIIEIYNGKHKIYYVKPLRVLTPAAAQKLKRESELLNHVIANNSENASEVPQVLSITFENGIFREIDKLYTFTCKKVTYIWDPDKNRFVKLRGLDSCVSSELLHRSKGLTRDEQRVRRLVYGPNEIIVKELGVLALLFMEVLNPFYIFQLFSFCLWFADSYYYYATAILLMSVFGITMTILQTRKNQRNLRSTLHSTDVCMVVRPVPKTLDADGAGENAPNTEVISTDLLVPGDLLEIPAHGCIMPCDAILLTGNCIVNESMLTGESVPVTKTPLPNHHGVQYEPKEHSRHTLFCGTQVIQTRYFGSEKVLAVVIRTGFSTAKGGLVRSILYPPPVDFRFEKDSYRFVTLLAIVASFGFVYTIITKYLRDVPVSDLIVEALDLITIVIPPALPAAMTVGSFYAQKRLKKNQIFCISPRSINVSGSVDCVCFDKTGTLTEDGLDMLCVVPIEEKVFQMPVKNIDAMKYGNFMYGLVTCHSLTIIDKQLSGDPLDLKMFESTKWTFEEHDTSDNTKFNMIFPTVVKPPKNRPGGALAITATPNHHINAGDDLYREDEELQIGIVREFPFSSSSQRMGVIVRRLGAQYFEFFIKGSPEMILNFCQPQSVPEDFHSILESYTQEGYRVIALAHKELKKMTYTKIQKVQREVIECDMTLLGLIVLENRLKPDTTPCIKMLNNANVRTVMVTGDNILTALSVARDCCIVTSGQSVITVDVDSDNQLVYTLATTKNTARGHQVVCNGDFSLMTDSASVVSLDTVESALHTVENGQAGGRTSARGEPPSCLFNNYRFAMTGKVWETARHLYPELIPRLATRGAIFARMSPNQKQQLVQELQALGYYVAMCGDGANDCGALKAAHTGISLSDAESSVASPFTSKIPNITCVLDIIKEGRAALVTAFGIFKYMAAYSLCQFISVMILYSIDSNLTDIQFLYIDLFIISVFAFFFGKTEAYSGKLVKETPLSSLISFTPIVSLFIQLFLVIGFQVGSFEYLKQQEWFEPFNSTAKEEKDSVSCVENYTIFTVSSFQYLILAIVFSKGKPYRQSIFSNYGFIISAVVLTGFSVYMALIPSGFLVDQFELILPDPMDFRIILLGLALVNFVLSLLFEIFIVEHIIFKKFRFKWHDIYKSRRKFLAVEKDLNLDSKWPMLSSDFRSAASPRTFTPSCTAEIVIEKAKSFEKNHILNSILNETPQFQQKLIDAAKMNGTANSTELNGVSLPHPPGSPAGSSSPNSPSSFGSLNFPATPKSLPPVSPAKSSTMSPTDFESCSTPDSVIGIGNFESFTDIHRLSEDSTGNHSNQARSRKSSALEMNDLEFR